MEARKYKWLPRVGATQEDAGHSVFRHYLSFLSCGLVRDLPSTAEGEEGTDCSKSPLGHQQSLCILLGSNRSQAMLAIGCARREAAAAGGGNVAFTKHCLL